MKITEDNYINLVDEEREGAIYRITDAQRLIYMFESKKLILRRPALWDDPFENILSRSFQTINGLSVGFNGVMECFYGQCWTLVEESDAMWRIYAPCRQGVKIKTTIRKLLAAIHDPKDLNSDSKFFIGKVDYQEKVKIGEFIQETFLSPDVTNSPIINRTFRPQALTLFIKPKPFEYEKEVRLIYRSDSRLQENEKTFTIDPNQLIDEIIFDSRMEPNQFEYYTGKVKESGYTGEIRRSDLYDTLYLIQHKHSHSR